MKLIENTQGECPHDKQKKMDRTKQAKLNGRISSGKRESEIECEMNQHHKCSSYYRNKNVEYE